MTGQWFHYRDVPPDRTVLEHIRAHSDWDQATARLRGRFEPNLGVAIPVPVDDLRREIARAYGDLGWYRWRSTPGGSYSGLAVTHNPERGAGERYNGLLGHERYRDLATEDYFAVDRQIDAAYRVRGDYLDTLGFRRLNDFSPYPALSTLLGGFRRPISRSRIASLFCVSQVSPPDVGWHVDEPPTTLLRINICIESDADYALEYQDGPAIPIAAGECLVVNTDVQHRVAVRHPSISTRSHLVIGVLPWLDYDADQDAWRLNDFYGRIHPYDMVREGLIHAGL